MKKVVIVGAGISGVSLSRMLSQEMEVKILERSSKAGGLIKCDRIEGALFHKVGGHVFNSRNETVLDWFWKHFDRDIEFKKANRKARIFLNDKYVGYPLEDYLYQLQEADVRQVISELLEAEASKVKPDNFKDFLIGSFGKTLYALYFGPYNTKLWNTDLSKVPLAWLEGKLPMPSKAGIMINNILRKEESEMVHASFYYPKQNGSQFIIDRLSEGQDIILSCEVNKIAAGNPGMLIINDEYDADHLVYCGDVRKLHSIIHINDKALIDALEAVKDFASNGTSNVLCETDDNDMSWLYIPETKFKAHRIIYTGNFSETNNGENRRKTCVVEFSGKQTEEDILNELKKLPGNLVPLAFNYEPNSYIIHSSDTRSKIAAAVSQLNKYNITLLGRFAEWEYYNMDKCIEGAMKVSKRLLS